MERKIFGRNEIAISMARHARTHNTHRNIINYFVPKHIINYSSSNVYYSRRRKLLLLLRSGRVNERLYVRRRINVDFHWIITFTKMEVWWIFFRFRDIHGKWKVIRREANEHAVKCSREGEMEKKKICEFRVEWMRGSSLETHAQHILLPLCRSCRVNKDP